ncbi:phage tail tube protein [Brevundimonas subvibrioides]|uniref:Phage tail protein n=1 Tax=Brevundimonas subvibrioides (strain ATCC 15264 / DSM 4735 / LMG 14903 / NBRC 16000 / CB 81) TaxID=633149 RepID=D9QI86_BRESC|nr:phage tail tube protein [Brevundimonas subvibrioides]ADK99388.1 hypothetical protein Bresu_0074 [Brevundimonas subvibrioides ATCC 15264]
MSRARGSNALMALAYETDYGVSPGSGYKQVPFVSSNIGESQGLIESDVLGFGRDPQQPGRDVVENAGDVVVPMCARNIGFWLKLLFGAPTTTAGLAATGSLTFTAQPTASSTITIGGQAFTFVSTTPTTNQIKIGATLAETVANAVRALNLSVVAGVAAATYRGDPRGARIDIAHDTIGTSGNSMTLAAGTSPASNVTVSGATLAGGATSGGYNHVFIAGAQTLPSASIEIGMPEVPSYGLNWGVKANTFGVPLQRGGNLNATIGLVAQGETTGAATSAGSPTLLDLMKFSSFAGLVRRSGAPVADLVSGQFNASNGLDPVPAIRGDGRISGADEGMLSVTGQVGIRYSTRELQVLAEDGTASELEFAWTIPASIFALRAVAHNVYLPRAKTPVTGPTGIQADYAWQASEAPGLGRTLTITLVNDVASY